MDSSIRRDIDLAVDGAGFIGRKMCSPVGNVDGLDEDLGLGGGVIFRSKVLKNRPA